MAQWQKIIVSGSDAILKTVTLDNGIAIGSQILSSSQAGTKLSGSFTGSFTGDGSGLTGVSAAGTVSSSAQIAALLPASTVSSSAQVTALLPASTVSSSIQIDYNSITNKLSGVVSSSAQIAPLLPASTVSSSAQVIAAMPGAISSSTQFQTLANPFTGSFTGSFVGSGASLTGLNIGSALNVDVYKFVGDASTTLFTVSSSYFVSSVFVSVDGLSLINTEDYSISGAGITFVTAPPSASNIVVRALINAQSSGTGSFTGSFTGDGSGLTGVSAAGTVSSSAQIAALLPASTVSSSAQVDYNSITNKLSGVVSSSAQVAPLLPGGTVSASAQLPPLLPAGTVSSSTQLPAGTVSSSAQFPGWVTASSQIALTGITGTTFAASNFTFPQNLTVGGTLTAERIQTEYITSSIIFESGSTKFGDTSDDTHAFTGSLSVLGSISGALVLPAGVVTASSQIDYNSITNKLSGVVSSSAQFTTLANPFTGSFTGSFTGDGSGLTGVSAAGTVSSSAQIAALLPASTVSSSTQFQTLANPFTGSFTGSFTGDGAGLTGIASTLATAGGAGTGTVALQSQTLTIAGGNGVTTSANAQTITVSAPAGTVSSSIQVDYNSITNKLSGVVSSSAQVAPLLPASTVSSSAQVTALLPASTVSSSTQFQTLSDPFTGSFTGSFTGVFPYGSLSSIPGGIVSSSAQVAPLLPGGSVSSSAQYPGWVTASSQIDYNSITNKLSGVVSSSAQVAPLLPAGTVSSSGQVTLSGITGTTFSTADFTFPQNLTVAGNLFVDGTTTTVNTANLNIEDRFILVNSGSVPGGNAQGGIIAMDNGANASGSAVFYSTENSINRWGLAENVASNATVVTQTAYVAAVVDMTVAAQSASLATYAKPGNIRVETNGDVFIYG